MGVINTGNFPAWLIPGATKLFGDAYNRYDPLYSKMLEVLSSDRDYEEDGLVHGLGVATAKPEGSAVSYDVMKQQYIKRYLHVTYANGFVMSEEAMEDLKSEQILSMRVPELKKSLLVKREMVSADLLNNGFSSSYTHGDGVELLATTHPSLIGNQANELSTAADLSEASLVQAILDIRNMKDHRGIRMAVVPKMLIIPPDLEAEAFRLLESTLRPGTADNDASFLRGRFSEGMLVNPYLTDTDAFFIKTDVSKGLRMYVRRDMRIDMANDADTFNVKWIGSDRYSVGASDFRGIFGSPGA